MTLQIHWRSKNIAGLFIFSSVFLFVLGEIFRSLTQKSFVWIPTWRVSFWLKLSIKWGNSLECKSYGRTQKWGITRLLSEKKENIWHEILKLAPAELNDKQSVRIHTTDSCLRLNKFILARRERLKSRLILAFSTLKKMYALDETTSAWKLISNVVTLTDSLPI